MAEPLISVVIPTRHRDDLLARCLDQLAPGVQTLPADQYEVIVSDDGSAQTAEAMIRRKYPWAKWTAGPRKGPAANRNHGASLARGQWIAFTDDDCVPDPGWLAGFAAAIEPGVKVYEGKTTCREGVHSPMMHAPVNETGGWLWSCNMMVQAELFRAIRFDEDFPQPHMEDVYFRECLKRRGEAFVFVPEASIDHPPRRRASGVKWASTHESEVVYCYKMGQAPLSLTGYAWRMIKLRARNLLRHRLGADSFVAAFHAVTELWTVGRRYNGWRRKHRHLR